MDCARSVDDQEVIHETAIRTQGLGAYACLSGDEIVFADLRDQLLQAANESAFTEGSVHFFEPRFGMFSREAPESGVGHGVYEIPQIERCAAVTFALKAKYSVRARVNAPVDHSGEMNPQKREIRVRHRVNEISHE